MLPERVPGRRNFFSLPSAVVGAVKKFGANLPPRAKDAAWPLFAGLCWGGVMSMWESDKKKLQKARAMRAAWCSLMDSPLVPVVWCVSARSSPEAVLAPHSQGLVASMDYIYRDSDLSALLSWCATWSIPCFPARTSRRAREEVGAELSSSPPSDSQEGAAGLGGDQARLHATVMMMLVQDSLSLSPLRWSR